MNTRFDALVLGLGGNGSSAIYHLSKTGMKVGGIDRFQPPHAFGSSHGQSRIIRQAYYEHPLYVPLVKAAYEEWYALEKVAGEQLFLKTGGLMLGQKGSAVVEGSRLSAETHNIGFQMLDSEAIALRFPAFRPTAQTIGLLENEAGILFPEKCIETFLRQAAINNASLIYNEEVRAILPQADSIKVVTSNNEYYTSKLIVTTGAWINKLVPELKLPLVVARQVLHWFRIADKDKQEQGNPNRMPVYIWEYEPGRMFYGFPDLGDGLKVAFHHGGESVDPDSLKQEVKKEEIGLMRAVAEQYLGFDLVYNYSVVCKYTNTPDLDFIIDYHPENKNIIIASPCSGHGFKFTSITGEILTRMALNKPLAQDISAFRISRFY